MDKEWIDAYVKKEMMLLFEGKRLDVPLSFKKAIAISIERAIKTTYGIVENEGN